MEPDEVEDLVVQEIMATLDSLFLAEKQARLQVSALKERQYPLAETFEMVQDMGTDTSIEEALIRFGFDYHAIDDDAELWISDDYGLMIFISFTDQDGRYYNYRIITFDIVDEDEEVAA
jgi:hypothetical protein